MTTKAQATSKDALRNLRRSASRARNQPGVTCSASRHVHQMVDGLLSKHGYSMLTEEPEHCAMSLLAVLEALWEARAEIKQMKSLKEQQK